MNLSESPVGDKALGRSTPIDEVYHKYKHFDDVLQCEPTDFKTSMLYDFWNAIKQTVERKPKK